MTVRYAFGKIVKHNFSQAIELVTAELAKEGFGVLTEIDVAATLKKKLDLDWRPYKILGACNPKLASQALTVEPEIGVLLPCNVVVREDERGRTRVDIMDPNAVLELVDRPEVPALATEVRTRLDRVLAAL